MTRVIKYHVDTLEDIISKIQLDESRFLNCCLLGVEQGVRFKDEVYYPVDVDRYAEVGGVSRGRAIEEILDICEKHKTNSLQVAIRGGVLHTSLIYEYSYIEEQGIISINWNPKFIPYISGKMIPGKFLSIEVNMDRVSSGNRYCMYILLEKHLWRLNSASKITLTEEEIRSNLSLKENTYTKLSELNKKIIKPTLNEMYLRLGKNLGSKVKGNKVEIFNIKEDLYE